jgi:phage terminase small subunit
MSEAEVVGSEPEGLAVEVDMNSGEETGTSSLPIPTLNAYKGKSLSEELTELGHQQIQEEREYHAETLPERKIKNPDARARRLETERNELTAQLAQQREYMEDMAIELGRLKSLAAQPAQLYEQPQEEFVDEELDPIGGISHNIKKLNDKLAHLEQQREYEKQQQHYAQSVNLADRLIASRIQENPEVNRAAMQHLAGVVYQQAMQNMPHLTSRERYAETQRWINEQKINWVNQGYNPADQLLNMAAQYGFNPNAQEEAPAQRRDQGREAIRKDRNRTKSTASMGGIDGVAPSTFNPSAFKGMDGDGFNKTVDTLIKSNKIKAGKTIGKTPSLSELLPGKGIRVR